MKPHHSLKTIYYKTVKCYSFGHIYLMHAPPPYAQSYPYGRVDKSSNITRFVKTAENVLTSNLL